jgi:hypothetical protein
MTNSMESGLPAHVSVTQLRLEKPEERLANLAADQPPGEKNHILTLRCQDGHGRNAWIE